MSSDQQDGFQDLAKQYQQILDTQQPYKPNKYSQQQYSNNNQQYSNNNQQYSNQYKNNQSNNPTQSTIRYNKCFNENIYKVSITSGQNKIDMNILESQFYLIKVYKKQKLIRTNLQRRYSDFDLLFQILDKKYPGYIFPAFPQKGLLSYVKTKVTVVKDQKLIKNRILMIQRFLNKILNQPKFNIDKCTEIKKFFSPIQEFQIFKKTAKQQIYMNTSIVDSTWGMITGFFKMSQSTKYTSTVEQIKKQKVAFQQLFNKVHEYSTLISDQLQANKGLIQCQNSNYQRCVKLIGAYPQLKRLVESINEQLKPIYEKLLQLQFVLQCQNEDYLMILKKIEVIEQMRQSQQNYKNLGVIQSEFGQKRIELKQLKKERIQRLKSDLKDMVQKINELQRSTQQ